MTSSTVALVLAGISAVVSVATAIGTERFRRGSGERLAELEHSLTMRREAATKEEQARALVARYRDPLLQAAYDLQSRLYNVLRPGGFRGGRDPDYFRANTLFLFAELFGWVEVIRLEMQFLDLGATRETSELSDKVAQIQDILASTSRWHDPFYIYRGQQRAMGELMLRERDARSSVRPGRECIGYAAFVTKLAEPDFAQWFSRLGDAVDQLKTEKSERLVSLQHALIDLIDFLDPTCDRFTTARARL